MLITIKPYTLIFFIFIGTFIIAAVDNDYFEIELFALVILSLISINTIKDIKLPAIILIYLIMVSMYLMRDFLQTSYYRNIVHYHNLFRGPLVAILLISLIKKYPYYTIYIEKILLILNILLLGDIIIETFLKHLVEIPWDRHGVINVRAATIFTFPHRAAVFSFFSLLILSRKPFDLPAIVCILSILVGGSRTTIILLLIFYIINIRRSNLKQTVILIFITAISMKTILEGIIGKIYEDGSIGSLRDDFIHELRFSYSSDLIQNIYIWIFGNGLSNYEMGCKFTGCVEKIPVIYAVNAIGIINDIIPLYGVLYILFLIYFAHKLNKYIVNIKGKYYSWYSYYIVLINFHYSLILETPTVDIMWVTYAFFFCQYQLRKSQTNLVRNRNNT
jgi:hypothetical protein